MVKSVLAFEKVGQVGLANLENRLSQLWLVQHPKYRFPCPSTKCDDLSMLSGHLDDRNLMIMSIILSGRFWVSIACIIDRLSCMLLPECMHACLISCAFLSYKKRLLIGVDW
jgi:hypothetical protein